MKLKLPSKQCFHNRTWKYFCEEIVVRASSSSWQLFDSLLSNAPCRGASFLLLRCILSFPPVVGIAALLQPDKTKAHTQKLVDVFASTRFLNFYLAIPESLPVSAGAPSFGSVPAKPGFENQRSIFERSESSA